MLAALTPGRRPRLLLVAVLAASTGLAPPSLTGIRPAAVQAVVVVLVVLFLREPPPANPPTARTVHSASPAARASGFAATGTSSAAVVSTS